MTEQTADDALAPCPFCGHETIHSMIGVRQDRGYVMMCGKCGIRQGSSGSTKAEAISAWNARRTANDGQNPSDPNIAESFARAYEAEKLASYGCAGLVECTHPVSGNCVCFNTILARRDAETWNRAVEAAASIAEEWRDENKASASSAEKQGNRGFAAELRTAAQECHALATAIASLKDQNNA